ncbi:hypothetical protein PV10_09166 [Exophiala mesophila]|nr:uncharacterized protein PV10_09166 [Exophiala mesophila]KIV87981.1 hypothetical protein PV10_09166 [Exophiala mesophila]
MEGIVKDGECLSYAKQKWTAFGAAWKRRPDNRKIPHEVSESVYYYIETELKKKRNLSTERRQPHFMTVPHFIILTKHNWQKDWHQYTHPRSLVQNHAANNLFIYTPSRVGEIFESNMRRGSGRGLLYKDVVFVVFKNEKGEAELAFRATRDAKGFTNKPHKRPQHGVYEDMQPLYANPVLPLLAIALADGAFQDYLTFEEIEAIPPPVDGSLHHLRIRKELHRMPFFQTMSPEGPTGKIQTAASFSSGLVGLGHRAGYEENIRVHDFRREVLVRADDNGYSIAERMKFAGHENSDTFFGSYMPQISTVDGQSSYWGKARRTVYLEGFRGLSLQHHPQMLQSLPAKVEANLKGRADFIALNEEIESLGERIRRLPAGHDGQRERTRREELYWQKRQMVSEELSRWQEIQPRKVNQDTEAETSPVASLPSFFSRVRRLDPPRDRLASSLFLDVPLRSPEGRASLQDMITLCRENPKVAYRPSLRPENGLCPVSACAVEMGSLRLAARWDHIYRCHKASLAAKHGTAELCFECDEWITGKQGWRGHCRHHLNDLESLPVQWNPLTFRQTLAAVGYCGFCLFDPLLPPEVRFRQYTKKPPWQQHLDSHFEGLEGKDGLGEEDGLALASDGSNEIKMMSCPDPRCGLSFNAIVDLQYHAQDTHCYKRTKVSASKRHCHISRSHLRHEDSSIAFTAIPKTDCYDTLPSSVDWWPREAAAPVDLPRPSGSPHLDMSIDPRLSDLGLTNFASAMGLGGSCLSPKRTQSSSGTSPSKAERRGPDAVEAAWPVEQEILPSWPATDATVPKPPSAGSRQRTHTTVSHMADVAMMQTPLETGSAIGQWLDRRARNLPPIGASREDDRTAGDALAFTGDDDKSADLDSDLFPSRCTKPHDTIGSLEPRDVDVDAIFNQYLCSPSASPPPTSSPDDMTSELSGATLCDAGRDPSCGYSELYTKTSKSPAPEMSPESEIARDRDGPCHAANRTCIHLRVGQPKITLRLRLPGRFAPTQKEEG